MELSFENRILDFEAALAYDETDSTREGEVALVEYPWTGVVERGMKDP